MQQVNKKFAKNKLPINISYLVLFRPVFHEPPFENLEVFNEADRCASCNVVHMVITMSFRKYRYEVELRYHNYNNKFENEWCQLQYCDIYSDENMEELQSTLTQIAKITGLLILSEVVEMTEKK